MIKTEVVRARVTPEERVALELIAEFDRRKASEAVREIIREAAAARGLWPPEMRREAQRERV